MAEQQRRQEAPKRRSFLKLLKSVMGAFLGVQTHKHWEEDAQTITPLRVIIGGLMLGFVFFGTVFAITWVISSFIV
jgi:hypothetical protein